jgi:hypothetical protein
VCLTVFFLFFIPPGHDIINHGIYKQPNMLPNTIAPPYRMPPQPPPGTMNFISPRTMENFQDMNMDRNRNDASIPGAANIETTTLTTTSATYALRTHSSKFPVSILFLRSLIKCLQIKRREITISSRLLI